MLPVTLNEVNGVTGSMFADLTGVPGSQIQFIDDVRRRHTCLLVHLIYR